MEAQIQGPDAIKDQGIRASTDKHGPSGMNRRFGTSLHDLFSHSWRRISTQAWRWIPKGALLGETGYCASSRDIRRFGDKARVVRRNRSPPPLSRSFVEVVKEGGMDRGRGRFPRRFGDASRSWIGVNGVLRKSGWRRMIFWLRKTCGLNSEEIKINSGGSRILRGLSRVLVSPFHLLVLIDLEWIFGILGLLIVILQNRVRDGIRRLVAESSFVLMGVSLGGHILEGFLVVALGCEEVFFALIEAESLLNGMIP